MNLDPKAAAGSLKPQLQLVPPVFEESVAAALQQGAEKSQAEWQKEWVNIPDGSDLRRDGEGNWVQP